jgi:hypothetical protein
MRERYWPRLVSGKPRDLRESRFLCAFPCQVTLSLLNGTVVVAIDIPRKTGQVRQPQPITGKLIFKRSDSPATIKAAIIAR